MRYDVIKHAQPLYFHFRQKTVLAETAVDLILHEKTHNQELAMCNYKFTTTKIYEEFS